MTAARITDPPQAVSRLEKRGVSLAIVLGSVGSPDMDEVCLTYLDRLRILKSTCPQQFDATAQFYRSGYAKMGNVLLDLVCAAATFGIGYAFHGTETELLFRKLSLLPLLFIPVILRDKSDWRGHRIITIGAKSEHDQVIKQGRKLSPSSPNDLEPLQNKSFLKEASRWKIMWITTHSNETIILRTAAQVTSKAIAKQCEGQDVLPDFIFFDGCGCGSIEFLREFRNKTKYIFASEEAIFGSSLPLLAILHTVIGATSNSIVEVVNAIMESIQSSRGYLPTFAAFDCEQADPLLNAYDKMKDLLKNEKARDKILWAINDSAKPLSHMNKYEKRVGDLLHLTRNLQRLKHSLAPETLLGVWQVQQALSPLVVAKICRESHQLVGGLSYSIPEMKRFLGYNA